MTCTEFWYSQTSCSCRQPRGHQTPCRRSLYHFCRNQHGPTKTVKKRGRVFFNIKTITFFIWRQLAMTIHLSLFMCIECWCFFDFIGHFTIGMTSPQTIQGLFRKLWTQNINVLRNNKEIIPLPGTSKILVTCTNENIN